MLLVDADPPAPEAASAPSDRLAAAAVSEWTARAIGLTRWAGAGRKLTQAGRLTLTDARELVELLDTGDVIDPRAAGQVHRACGCAWAAASRGYRIADASDLHRDTWRRCNDRDVHRAVGVLARFGAVSIDGRQDAMRVTMTELGRRGMSRRLSEPGGAAARPESVLPDNAG